MPVLVRAGSVIVLRDYNEAISHGSASRPFVGLDVIIYPGATQGSTWVYDDDGMSVAYEKGTFSNTTVNYTTSNPCIAVNVGASGGFSGQPAARTYAFHLLQPMLVVRVLLDGLPLPQSQTDRVPGTFFSGPGGTSVYTQGRPVLDPLSLAVCHG